MKEKAHHKKEHGKMEKSKLHEKGKKSHEKCDYDMKKPRKKK